MHDPERRALYRAAVLLLAVSAVRWGVEVRGTGTDDGLPADDALAEHLASTTAATVEEDRRSRPLEDGERIDPNRADVVELDRLPGVGPSTAAAIVSARDTGVAFRRPDDLLVVRGIGPATLERMRPWLELSGGHGSRGRAPGRRAVSSGSEDPGGAASRRSGRGGERRKAATPVETVDVNRADLEELQRLPGVGPALAARIIETRRGRPFASVDDLERVRGIGPATVERLRPMAVAGPGR